MRLIANCLNLLLNGILMSCDTYLLLSQPQTTPYEQGFITSLCPLKTIETLGQGLFITLYAPIRLSNGLQEQLSWHYFSLVMITVSYFSLCFLYLYYCSFKPLCVLVKGVINKRRHD